jgi:hypothetical protein
VVFEMAIARYKPTKLASEHRQSRDDCGAQNEQGEPFIVTPHFALGR